MIKNIDKQYSVLLDNMYIALQFLFLWLQTKTTLVSFTRAYSFRKRNNDLQSKYISSFLKGPKIGSTTTDRKQTDHKEHRLAEKGDTKYIFTIPKAILPKPSLCDKITATKSVTKSCNKIIALQSVCSRSVCRGQLTWLAKIEANSH